jgi:hypothetical protein
MMEIWACLPACENVDAYPEVLVLGLEAVDDSWQPLCQQELQYLRRT